MWYRLLPFLSVVLIVAVWWIAAIAYDKPIVLPSPRTTFENFISAVSEARFWQAVGNTMLRSVAAFALAFTGAFALALLSVGSKVFFKLFYPVVVLLRALPTIAVIFICYIAITGWYRAVVISFIVIFPTLYSSFYTAFMGCRGELMEVGKIYNVSRVNVLTKYIIPSVWAGMFSDIVNTLSLTVKLIIAAEAITSTGISLGGLMKEYQMIFDMGMIFAYTVVAILLSYATELVVRITARIVKEVRAKCRLH